MKKQGIKMVSNKKVNKKSKVNKSGKNKKVTLKKNVKVNRKTEKNQKKKIPIPKLRIKMVEKPSKSPPLPPPLESPKNQEKLCYQIENIPNLIQENTFDVIAFNTKKFVVGFDHRNGFVATIILKSYQSFITLNMCDFHSIVLQRSTIESWFENQEKDNNIEPLLTSSISLLPDVKTNNLNLSIYDTDKIRYLHLEKNHSKNLNNGIFLNQTEFKWFVENGYQILQEYAEEMHKYTGLMENYFNWYVFFCRQLSKNALSSTEMYMPSIFQQQAEQQKNQEHLSFSNDTFFVEIPIICYDRIVNEIKK